MRSGAARLAGCGRGLAGCGRGLAGCGRGRDRRSTGTGRMGWALTRMQRICCVPERCGGGVRQYAVKTPDAPPSDWAGADRAGHAEPARVTALSTVVNRHEQNMSGRRELVNISDQHNRNKSWAPVTAAAIGGRRRASQCPAPDVPCRYGGAARWRVSHRSPPKHAPALARLRADFLAVCARVSLPVASARPGLGGQRGCGPVSARATRQPGALFPGPHACRLRPARSRQPLPVIDALIAATARVYRMTVGTRNVKDFELSGVDVLDPCTPVLPDTE